MEHENRIGYLCYQAARNNLTPNEEYELIRYIAVDEEIILLIEIENLIQSLDKYE